MNKTRERGLQSRLLLPIVIAALLVMAGLGIWLFAPELLPSFLRPSSGNVVTPSPEGRICFVRSSADGKSHDLYVVNPDGTGLQQATHDINIEGTNLWSPDGRRIIAQASVNGTSTIVRLDVGPDNKVSNAVQLTADVKADSAFPAWSPDGTQIAFQSKRDSGDSQVFVMDSDGLTKKRLSDGKGFAGQPAWSPDGKYVIYKAGESSKAGTTKDIFVVPAAGGTPKKLTAGDKDLSTPKWSPDGKHIMYIHNIGDRSSVIYMMNADGTSPQVLVQQGINLYPQFSPSGDKIALYSISQESGSDIFTVPAAGGALSNLTHLTTEDYEPAWSPDGGKLVWSGKRDGIYKIVVGNADGTNQKAITKGDDQQPSWGMPVK